MITHFSAANLHNWNYISKAVLDKELKNANESKIYREEPQIACGKPPFRISDRKPSILTDILAVLIRIVFSNCSQANRIFLVTRLLGVSRVECYY